MSCTKGIFFNTANTETIKRLPHRSSTFREQTNAII